MGYIIWSLILLIFSCFIFYRENKATKEIIKEMERIREEIVEETCNF